ncbi:GNAT family N-acetyltransferase [Rhodococcus sp. NPDC060090]|uniref:N-acetylglutamate synthase, CG3035 family n=1 Tax=Rhodococcus sp. NPDC060090 TaxID=3347056 RepID=UPI00365CBB6D
MTTDGPAGAPGTAIPLGTRVVVRYRLPAGYSHRVTDVIGELVSMEPAVAVRTAEKKLVQIAPNTVVALKALSARPIRTAEIRSLEHAAAAGWPGLEQAWIDGWFLRAGGGFTGRANSATPLGPRGTVADPADPEVRARLHGWFADRGLPLLLLLPERLAPIPAGGVPGKQVQVMAADLDNVPLPPGPGPVAISPEPDADWLALYRGGNFPDVAGAVLGAVAAGTLGFGRIGARGTAPIAIGRVAVTDAPDGRRWAGLSAVEVSAEHRRQGVGTLLSGSLLGWGRELGATHAYVQIETGNIASRELYAGLGFVDHHRYGYVTEPVG